MIVSADTKKNSLFFKCPTEKLAVSILSLGFFAAYLLTLSPDIYWRDSGELTAATYSLGSAHPSGFPLYLLLGKAFTFLPLGNIAYRTNLLSAFCGAVTTGLLSLVTFEIIREQIKDFWLCLIGGLCAGSLMGINIIFWRNSTVAEVYTPTVLLLVVCLYIFIKVRKNTNSPQSSVLALLCGLGFSGLHATLRLELFVGFFVAWVICLRRSPTSRLKLAPFFFCLGLSVIAYLPIISSKNPIVDWGHPAQLSRLWDHVMATRIRTAFAEQMFSIKPHVVIHNFQATFFALWDGLLGIGPGLSLIGLLSIAFTQKRGEGRQIGLLSLLLWIGLTDFIYSFWINPMGTRDLQNAFACIAVLSVLCGVGAVYISGFVSMKAPRLSYAIIAVLVCFALIPAAMGDWKEKAQGTDEGAFIWSRHALEEPIPGGLLLVTSDDLAAGITAQMVTDGARPDVAVVVRQHAWDIHHLKATIKPGIHSPPHFFTDLAADSLKSRHRGRLGTIAGLVRWSQPRGGVHWEPGDKEDLPAAPPLIPNSPLFIASNEPPSLFHLASARKRAKELLGEYESDMSREVLLRQLNAGGKYAYRRAIHLIETSTGIEKSRKAKKWLFAAVSLFRQAIEEKKANSPSLLNLGAALALHSELSKLEGKTEKAKMLLHTAIQLTQSYRKREPLKTIGLVNEARYEIKLAEMEQNESKAGKHLKKAQKLLLKAEDRGHNESASAFLLGVLNARLGRVHSAKKWFLKSIERDPYNKTARIYLEKIKSSF